MGVSSGAWRAGFLWPGPDPVTDDTHYTNHLITETSPTLPQYVQNLVKW